MTDVSGIGGSVVFAPTTGSVINVTEWSGNIECDSVAIPPTMNADPATENGVSAAVRFRGSLTGKLDDGAAPIDPVANSNYTATITLAIQNNTSFTNTISGACMVSNVSINRRLADADCTLDFRNTGTMTYTWT